MKNGIRSAWQSGRSPSQNSIDEASAASPIIRLLSNPVVARLKCAVSGSGHPCHAHRPSVRDKDEALATPPRSCLPESVLVSSLLVSKIGSPAARGNPAPVTVFSHCLVRASLCAGVHPLGMFITIWRVYLTKVSSQIICQLAFCQSTALHAEMNGTYRQAQTTKNTIKHLNSGVRTVVLLVWHF